MDRIDWLLLFLAADDGRPVDPVRVQKGLFLLAMRDVIPPAEAYDFEPYLYGPMSGAIYRDLRRLADHGLVERIPQPGVGWRAVLATQPGMERAATLGRQAPRAEAAVGALRREIDGLSFGELLRRVYAKHPEYAVRSVFRGRA